MVFGAGHVPGACRSPGPGELASLARRPPRDPGPRPARPALAALDEKGLNVEAIAVFAILAPRRARAPRSGQWLRSRSRSTTSTRSRSSERRATAPTSSSSSAPTGDVATLPAQGAVAAALDRAIARCGEGQAHTHAAEHGDRETLEAWARAQPAPAIFHWWEVAAGASSSVAAHALIAAAADPRTTPAGAELVDAAYFPSIGALTVLLDDLVDRDEDAAAGAHNYLAYYADSEDAATRLDLIAHLARVAIAKLRRPHRHAAILAGVTGFYLSAAEAETPYARPIHKRLLDSAGPAVRPIVAFMRRRRH